MIRHPAPFKVRNGSCPACARCAAGGQGHSPAELARYHPPPPADGVGWGAG